MFQYAIARALAEKNEDTFKMDLSFYESQKLRGFELDCFSIAAEFASQSECALVSGQGKVFKRVMARLGFNLYIPSSYVLERKSDETKFRKSIFNKSGSMYLEGYWQNERYFKHIRDVILNDFRIKDRISDSAVEHLKNIKVTPSVSLHIRRGDYLSDLKVSKVHGMCDLEYYQKAISYLSSRIQDPVIYVFSDDIEWCKKNLGFLKNKVFIDNTKTAIEDLELMRNCDHNIIANSTFSWWGAWLNENDDKIVVAPRKWFFSERMQHLTPVPTEWMKI
jgi:hypothetical protein